MASTSGPSQLAAHGAVLVALPDLALAQALASALQTHHHRVAVADSPTEAVRLAEQLQLALVITDAMLPPVAGKGALAWIREQPRYREIPALILSPTTDGHYGTDGLDQPLTKPVDMTAALWAVDRLIQRPRANGPAERTQAIGDLSLDLGAFELSGPAATVVLTPIEFRLLRTLSGSAQGPMTNADLIQELWPGHVIGGVELLRVHIRNLRGKLDRAAGTKVNCIHTIPKVGYMLSEGG